MLKVVCQEPPIKVLWIKHFISLVAYDFQMATFADSLKKEIARVARKELREDIGALRKTSALQRSEIAALKKNFKALEAQVKKQGRHRGAPSSVPARAAKVEAAAAPKGKPGRKVVFTAERLKAQRAKLGFTQQQIAKLLEVSALSIWKWESGGAVPRASRVPHILQRLSLGKREALALIAE